MGDNERQCSVMNGVVWKFRVSPASRLRDLFEHGGGIITTLRTEMQNVSRSVLLGLRRNSMVAAEETSS